MLLFVNQELEGNEEEWSARNGATRTTLKLINKEGFQGTEFRASVGTLDKGNHAFIFLNKEKIPNDNRIVGLFLNGAYSYTVIKKHSPKDATIYENSSCGGYGNSCSTFGLYKLGTTLAVHSYKYRSGDRIYRLTKQGWEDLGVDVPLDETEIKEI